MPQLDWINKDHAKSLLQDIPVHLLKQLELFGETEGAYTDNLLIRGDNLLALKALCPLYSGRVKCVFIDPPYNTQSAFQHYDDRLEHSQWLSMMYPRLVLLRQLLREDGSIWITLDDAEAHYCKVLMDEIFGRRNFVANVVWQKKYSPGNNQRGISSDVDHVLVYGRSREKLSLNLLPRTDHQDRAYKNPDNDPRGLWKASDLTRAEHRDRDYYPITTPSGKDVWPAKGRSWSRPPQEIERLRADNRLWFGTKGDAKPSLKRFLSEVQEGVVAKALWPRSEVGDNEAAKKEAVALNSDNIFGTPKPEKLLHRVLQLGSSEGDLVLDSFLGSGTTSAVAHKLGRRHIGIEMGEHAESLCLTRLKKVVEGETGGISESIGWSGGGGFKYCVLGEAAFDSFGKINPEVTFSTLASFIWNFETGTHSKGDLSQPYLGAHEGKAYYLLFNGVLGDRRPKGGNVLTRAVLEMLKSSYPHAGPKIVYGETTKLGAGSLAAENVTFQQIPYDIKLS